jgi:AmmeMemoRadiSam system protein A
MQTTPTDQPDPNTDFAVPSLSEEDRRVVLQVVTSTIVSALRQPDRLVPDIDPRLFTADLQQTRGTFVTLHCRGELRGCRGSIGASAPLIVDVSRSARAAAFFDERFSPVSAKDIRQLDLHVSILSTPRPLPVESEEQLLASLRKEQDGLIVRADSRQALFLPAMWQKLPDPQKFVKHLKEKAGLPSRFWSSSLVWLRFEVEEFSGRCADFLPSSTWPSDVPHVNGD